MGGHEWHSLCNATRPESAADNLVPLHSRNCWLPIERVQRNGWLSVADLLICFLWAGHTPGNAEARISRRDVPSDHAAATGPATIPGRMCSRGKDHTADGPQSGREPTLAYRFLPRRREDKRARPKAGKTPPPKSPPRSFGTRPPQNRDKRLPGRPAPKDGPPTTPPDTAQKCDNAEEDDNRAEMTGNAWATGGRSWNGGNLRTDYHAGNSR